jgi:hypothetical protein
VDTEQSAARSSQHGMLSPVRRKPRCILSRSTPPTWPAGLEQSATPCQTEGKQGRGERAPHRKQPAMRTAHRKHERTTTRTAGNAQRIGCASSGALPRSNSQPNGCKSPIAGSPARTTRETGPPVPNGPRNRATLPPSVAHAPQHPSHRRITVSPSSSSFSPLFVFSGLPSRASPSPWDCRPWPTGLGPPPLSAVFRPGSAGLRLKSVFRGPVSVRTPPEKGGFLLGLPLVAPGEGKNGRRGI